MQRIWRKDSYCKELKILCMKEDYDVSFPSQKQCFNSQFEHENLGKVVNEIINVVTLKTSEIVKR